MPAVPVSSGLVDFALGAALITLPQYKVPLAAGTLALGLVKRITKRKSSNRDEVRRAAHADGEEVHLQWSDLRCSITNKKGVKKDLLTGIAGEASPGR